MVHAGSAAGRSRERRPLARKRFGQHFLEPIWARKVVDAIAPQGDEVFLEVGPGRGAITRPLASAAAAVLACEIDRDLAETLRAAGVPRVRVLESDFLHTTAATIRRELDHGPARTGPIRVAGNLPYNMASPILFHLIDLARQGLSLRDATVMLQREVADRLLAPAGTRDYGVLSVLIRHHASAARLLDLPPGAFRPAPKVHSTVVRLEFHAPQPPSRDERRFAAIAQGVFSRRRKTVANALLACSGVTPDTAARALSAAGIDRRRRPETLTLEEFVTLADHLRVATGVGPSFREP